MKKLCVFMAIILITAGLCPAVVRAETDYSAYSNTFRGWGLGRNTEHKTPSGMTSGKDLKKFNAYYVGDTTKKVCYFTFDCGYDNGNTEGILDTLQKQGIQAVFFVTEDFVRSHTDLVKRMKEEGHLVGNHTKNHPNLTTCSVNRIRQEMKSVEKAMKECTGFKIDKIMRPPEGAYSDRVLKVLADMGYRTLFWSNAWKDWDENNQPTVDFVVNQFKTYYHNGMVPLMHSISSADRKALPRVIRYLKQTGFTFERFDNFYKEDPKLSVSVKNYVYDGKRATKHMTIKTKSGGDCQTFFYKGKMKLKRAPKDTGKYTVKVVQEATEKYRAVTVEKKFEIKKVKPEIRIFAVVNVDGKTTRIEAGQKEIIIPVDAEYTFDIQCANKKGEQTISYFDSDGEEIDEPDSPGEYILRVEIGTTRNYKVTAKRIRFVVEEDSARSENVISKESIAKYYEKIAQTKTMQRNDKEKRAAKKKSGLKNGSYMVTHYKSLKIKKNTIVLKSGLKIYKDGDREITYKVKKRTFKKARNFKILGYGVDENGTTDSTPYTLEEFNKHKNNLGEWGMLNIVIKNGRIKEISVIS